jgi:hypothetical protein
MVNFFIDDILFHISLWIYATIRKHRFYTKSHMLAEVFRIAHFVK